MSNLDEILIKEEDIVRFAILFGDSNATNFNTNLSKMIELVLYQKHPVSMTTDEIAKVIKDIYQMEFSTEEIYDVICSKMKLNKKEKFLLVSDKPKKFGITTSCYQSIDDKYAEKNIATVIKAFYDEHADFISFGEDKIEEIIKRYIYLKFNKDAKTLKAILSLDPEHIYEEDKLSDFSEEEKEVLNAFFAWENEKKNSLVYEILSSALQYCMMTTKRNNAISNSMFRGKVFYLDTNIIFRLAGLNREERKESAQNFIRKCNECKVTLKYTNFTRAEIDSTLDSAVNNLKYLMGGKLPMGRKGIRALKPNIPKIDLYYVYVDWAIDPNNHRPNDYVAYRRYLTKQIDDVLEKFVKEDFESYSGLKTAEAFEAYVKDLGEYKSSNSAESINEQAVKIDIENYMYIQERGKKENRSTLLDKQTFFISADHRLINWAAQRMPGTVPSYVLPSFWYSFMLRYHGRATQDDFSAFCQFLKLRPAYKKEIHEKTRLELTARILRMDEPSTIKDEIAIDVNERLRNYTRELTAEEIELVISESVDSVIDKKVDIKVEEKWKSKEESHRIQVEESYEEGSKAMQDKIIQGLTNKAKKRNRIIKNFLNIVFIVVIAYIAISLFSYVYTGGKNEEINKILSAIADQNVAAIFSLLVALIIQFVKKFDFFTEDEEKIKAKLNRDINK